MRLLTDEPKRTKVQVCYLLRKQQQHRAQVHVDEE